MTVQVRLETFEDVQKETPLLNLPVVFTGTIEQAKDYCEKQGYEFKPSRKQLYGGYFYRREPETTALLLT
jgi:putative hemolysin